MFSTFVSDNMAFLVDFCFHFWQFTGIKAETDWHEPDYRITILTGHFSCDGIELSV